MFGGANDPSVEDAAKSRDSARWHARSVAVDRSAPPRNVATRSYRRPVTAVPHERPGGSLMRRSTQQSCSAIRWSAAVSGSPGR